MLSMSVSEVHGITEQLFTVIQAACEIIHERLGGSPAHGTAATQRTVLIVATKLLLHL